MKSVSIAAYAAAVAFAATAPAVSGRLTLSPALAGSSNEGADNDGAATVRPPPPIPTEPSESSASSGTSTSSGSLAGAAPVASPLDDLKASTYKGEWHMKPVRMIHARVQSDAPELVEGRFVSSFGKGDLSQGYLSGMDNVNTASVEGALMYVQAEGINVNSRAKEDRCTRKNDMRNIVFYEIVMVQTNESIAEFSGKWKKERDAFEYGPMVPMDGGRCTAESATLGKDALPKACLQYNGEKGEVNLGPFVGGGIKDDDVRAPYPDTYWFSFPNTCPTQPWAKKNESCRASTRKGLCDLGVAPDGVQCTFAYDILGWIPIDDVVGITSMKNKETGGKYTDLAEWCKASTKNNEFVGDVNTGKMKSGLPFWKNPLDKEANQKRAQRVVELYNKLVSGVFQSTQIGASLVKSFKPLPDIETLRKKNPICYESVPFCNTAYGCRREGYSQLCIPCKNEGMPGCKTEGAFTFPKLVRPKKADDLVDSSDSSDGSGESSGEDDLAAEPGVSDDLADSSDTKKRETAVKSAAPSSSVVSVAVTIVTTLSAAYLWAEPAVVGL